MEDHKEGLAAALDDMDLEPPIEIPAQAPLPFATVQAPARTEAERRRGPGRPEGSRNKRTEEWSRFLLSNYKSPLIALAETYTRSFEDLAKALGCSKLEALKLQLAAAERLAPYLHQKQPLAVQIDQKGVVNLIVTEEPPPPEDVANVIEIVPIETQSNQQVSARQIAKSDKPQSDKD